MNDFTLLAEILLIGLTFVVMLVGTVSGAFLPIPGGALVWIAAFGYGLVRWAFGTPFDGWVGGIAMVLLTLLALADFGLEIFVTHTFMAKEGVSWQAIALSFILSLVGLFIFPPIGPLVGALGGLFIVEYFRHQRDWRKALRGIWSYAKGTGWAMVAEVALCVIMMGVWAWWVVISFLI